MLTAWALKLGANLSFPLSFSKENFVIEVWGILYYIITNRR